MKKPNHTPEQIAANVGVELAFEANKAFDAHDSKFYKIAETAGNLMGRGSLGESAVNKAFISEIKSDKTTLENINNDERNQHLTPEQQKKIDKTIEALVSKFDIDAKDLTVLMIETKAGKKPVVVYTAGSGIDLGDPKEYYDKKRSWNNIFDKKNTKDFIIEVNGQQVDTRKGMTRAVCDAMYNYVKANGQVLPDSQELAKQNDQPWTYTLLTGEDADQDYAPIARDFNGEVNQFVYRCGIGSHNLRFRPAVVIV